MSHWNNQLRFENKKSRPIQVRNSWDLSRHFQNSSKLARKYNTTQMIFIMFLKTMTTCVKINYIILYVNTCNCLIMSKLNHLKVNNLLEIFF